jgi:hypothetical protein
LEFTFDEINFGLDVDNDELKATYKEHRKQINYSLKKRFKYLQQRAHSHGFELTAVTDYDSYLQITKDEYNLKLITEKEKEKQEKPLIDYSESKLTEKIIALNELGVLDYLQTKEPFNISVNSLAEYLSLCLGEKTTSVQSYINPILNRSDQTKSPYNTTKTVEKAKQKLIQIGVKLE